MRRYFYNFKDRLSPHWKAPHSLLFLNHDYSKIETVKMGMDKAYYVFNYRLVWQERAAIGMSYETIEALLDTLQTKRIRLSIARDIDCS